ncbi:MAG: tetratricopeptide repeat protein, partial [Xanthomonadales bacterium]|nr:tetratricopeptide repeat protein [Xanthomonadales bacterium]
MNQNRPVTYDRTRQHKRTVHIQQFVLFLVLISGSNWLYAKVPLDLEDENQALRLHVASYEIVDSKLGDPAPEGSRFLVIKGTLTNKNSGKGVSIPPVEKAFSMRLNGSTMIELVPISGETADPFWGPLELAEGEQRPVEMVFVVPESGVESAEIRHLSNMGSMSIFILGTAPEAVTEFLAGPESAGFSQIAVTSVMTIPAYDGQPAPAGWQFLQVDYLFTNLMELHPLETNIASLSTLVEDGGYLYQPLSAPKRGEAIEAEQFFAQEPTAGKMEFLIPIQHGVLELVHFTDKGPIRLNLTPDRPRQPLPQAIAGPTREGRIAVSLYGIRPATDGGGLIVDLGLSLNMNDSMADLPIDLSKAFELHDPSGQFRKAEPRLVGVQHPLGQVVIRRDQVTRGEVAFRGVTSGAGQTLVLPLSSGHVRLDLPDRAVRPTHQIAQTLNPLEALTRSREPPQHDPYRSGQYSDEPDPRIGELLFEAEQLMRQRKLTTPRGDSALDRLDEVLFLDPYNPNAVQMLVNIYQTYVDWALTAMQRSQNGQAARYAEQALLVLGRDPAWFGVPQAEVAHLYFIQGEALAKHGQPATARSAFFRALALDPEHEDAQLALDQLDTAPVPRPDPEAPVESREAITPETVGDLITGIPQVLDTGLLRINRVMIPLYGVKGEHGQYVTNLE